MNKEEIEELKDFTIDLTDIDELALGLEVCSKKSNMVIQEFADTIILLQQENQKYKEVIDKANKKLNDFIECCKAEKLESGSDYLHNQYWDIFERFNKQIKDILKEVKIYNKVSDEKNN